MTSAHDPGSAPPRAAQTAEQRASAYLAVEASQGFRDLKKRHRGFVIPVTLGAIAFYFVYVILAAYAPDFMGEKVVGNCNVGLVFGLLQFVMTFGITAIYVRFARNHLDPEATRIREQMHREGLR